MRTSSLRDGNQLCAVNHMDLAGIVVTCYVCAATIISRVDGVDLTLV